ATSKDAFSERLERLDTSLFEAIPSESTPWDRRSLLACQHAVRMRWSPYVYLEIGSHLGGSLQPHVLDPGCAAMHSIDPRPSQQPDARGARFGYPGNSTARMLANLSATGRDTTRVVCHEQTSARLNPADIAPTPQLCFVDGEHTDAAVLADFDFCRRVITPGGLILFHDAHIIYNALDEIVASLDRAGTAYCACHLPDTLFAIELGEGSLIEGPALARVRHQSYRGYLLSLRSTDHYRRFANRWLFRALRKVGAVATQGPTRS
ncbi:MAG: class I SAM-dependent methyltransferase, partial [Vicinamibacterales bacterium]